MVVFVEGSTVSSFSGSGDAWGSSAGGTTEPQTIEVMKQLRRFCAGVRITADRSAADFLILHERQAGGTFGGNRNNVAAFGKRRHVDLRRWGQEARQQHQGLVRESGVYPMSDGGSRSLEDFSWPAAVGVWLLQVRIPVARDDRSIEYESEPRVSRMWYHHPG